MKYKNGKVVTTIPNPKGRIEMLNRKFKCLGINRSLKKFLIKRKTGIEINLAIAGLFTYLVADKELIMNLNESCHTVWPKIGAILAFICSIWSKQKPLTKKMCFISFEFLAKFALVFPYGSAIWILLASFMKKLEYFQLGGLSFVAIPVVFCAYFIMSLVLLSPCIANHKKTFLQWRKTTVLYSMRQKKDNSLSSKSSNLLLRVEDAVR